MPLRALMPARGAGVDGCGSGHSSKLRIRTDVLAPRFADTRQVETELRGTWWGDRSRSFKLLTFWLRPAFALRVVNRFQDIAGFDRAIALASSALTALIPMAIVFGSFFSRIGGKDTATRIIERYNLSGSGAEAVQRMFEPTGGSSTTIGIVGVLFLVLALLSFSRAMQRLFEQTWQLPPLSVRNTINGLRWAGGLVVAFAALTLVHAIGDHGVVEVVGWFLEALGTFAFLFWSGWVLAAKRIAVADLLPFAVTGAILL